MIRDHKLVEFCINEELFGVDIDQVKEILSSWTIIQVSTLQKTIAGVISLNGNDVPVINMRRLLGLDEPGTGITGEKIIIIGMKNIAGRSFGLLVDSVSNIIELGDYTLESIKTAGITGSLPYELGCVDGRIVVYGENQTIIRGDTHQSVRWLDPDTLLESVMTGGEYPFHAANRKNISC